MNENPFAAPVSEVAEEPQKTGNTAESGWAAFKTIFIAWEKLRFLFNFVLIFLVVAMATMLGGTKLLSSIEFWLMAIAGGIISNICFFLGPVAESYVHFLGLRLTWFRSTSFMLGLALTAAAALVAVLELAWKF